MNLRVLLVRAPGAETPTPILGYEYRRRESCSSCVPPGDNACPNSGGGELCRVRCLLRPLRIVPMPPGESACPQFWGKESAIWDFGRYLIDLHRCWKMSKPLASNTIPPELGAAFQRRGRALARLTPKSLPPKLGSAFQRRGRFQSGRRFKNRRGRGKQRNPTTMRLFPQSWGRGGAPGALWQNWGQSWCAGGALPSPSDTRPPFCSTPVSS